MAKFGVIGLGFVGSSWATVLAERSKSSYDVIVMDTALGVAQRLGHKLGCHSLSDPMSTQGKLAPAINFIAVPTPMNPDGSCNLSYVHSALEGLSAGSIAVIKSTMPPGTTARLSQEFPSLQIVFSPEFLTEANALKDVREQKRIILGGPRQAVNRVQAQLRGIFPDAAFVKTSAANAEMTKYVTNCFLATKVSFANEIFQICSKLAAGGVDIDYDRVIECVKLDPRVGGSHWSVPSFECDAKGDPLFGFSLSCFPKDINALISLAKSLDVNPLVLKAAWDKNVEVRPSKDWEALEGRAVTKKTS